MEEKNYFFDEKSKRFRSVGESARDSGGSFGGELVEIFKFAILALVIVLPVRIFIAQPFIVSGSSMDPTFKNGEYIIVDELSYRFGKPERGDVAIFKFPEDTSKYFIKRIVGLPNETVSVEGNLVKITSAEYPEGIVLQEPYIGNSGTNKSFVKLKDGEYFVMGDNRQASYDSRFWGAVPKNDIVGRAYLRLLPISQMDFLPGAYSF